MTTSWTDSGTEADRDELSTTSTSSTATSTAVGEPVDHDARELVVTQLKSEMQGPMVALQALRTTLEKGGLSEELDSRMRRHTTSLARRLSLLMEDLVLVYTWGHRRLVLDLQDLNLADQVARAADLFPDLLIYVEAPTEVRVRADALRLQQLLANLIHMGQRGNRPVCLYVACHDTVVTLRMIGAPPVGGYQLDIVRQLVDAHGGKLRHHAAEGAVTVTLRRVAAVRK